jgi:RES domain-containing protein
MHLWRISNYPSLNGEGGRLAASRWNSIGSPIVYLAASAAGALLETLVHLEFDEDSLPPTYTLLRVSVSSTVRIPQLKLPAGDAWKADLTLTRSLGDAWLKTRRSALTRVPSAILPDTYNYLLNPLHPDASRIKITASNSATLDPRLLRK